ncbi:MAG: lysoplasmalogenase [Phenylobacterium sp.]|uniref:lysoplasmalogenase family protein n=1 Tax=Phenylobacterium sp. TaxID=1871053 RepID=UPI001A527501|nr:lysoplasmalogenase family protein [Phenylobacterium sp.]MBL8770895.1 lysoplasmalogenase [Phenylobacterium sp.]
MNPRRILLAAAILAGTTYVASWFLPLPAAASVTWKGAGVALLAVYAATMARGLDGWLLAAVLAFGALGDVLLETHGLVTGALAFLAGHVTAIVLYLRNRRPAAAGDWAVALALFVGVPVIAYLLPPQREGAGLIALYAAGLSAMAAAAWLSRFPRTLVGAGAIMFAVSDLLIFLRTGRPALDTFPLGLAVWGLYFAGQALIAIGATRALGRDAAGRTS